MKIKLKPTIQIVEDKTHIYLRTSSYIHKISLNEDYLIDFFKLLLSNKHTIETIFITLKNKHTQITEDKIKELISQLDSLYLLEYEIKDTLLSNYELDRYHRNLNFFGSFLKLNENKYIIQNKLNNTKVVLLGLGGLGSHLLFDMAGIGIHNIKAIEFDNVELSNLNRQILYNECDIGNPKVDIARKKINKFNSKLNLEFINTKIASQLQLQSLITGYDAVICVADRPSRGLMNLVLRKRFRLLQEVLIPKLQDGILIFLKFQAV